MQCVCPKCGRKDDISVADLRAQQGTVVCPRCLTVYKVAVPPAPKQRTAPASAPSQGKKPAATYCRRCGARLKPGAKFCSQCGEPVAAVEPSKPSAPKPAPAPTPKPRRAAPTPINSNRTPQPTKPARPASARGKRKAARSVPQAPMGRLGCLLRTVVVTLIFFAFYFMVGVLFQ